MDGVLNTYTGNFCKDSIPDINVGAKNFLEELSNKYEIKLFTTRNKILATKWLLDNHLDKIVSDITNIKEVCYLFVDDRAIIFEGNYADLIEKIEKFKPWYK